MKRIAAVVCLLAAAVTAHGAEGSVGLGATAKIGTLGYGGELTIGLGPYLGLRGGYYTMDPEISYNADVGDVDITLDWQTIPLLLDVHPFGGGFRVSGGVVLNDNQVLAASEPGTELEFDGLPFTVERFDGSVTFDDQSYYFGIGYGNAVGAGGRWNFSCDMRISLRPISHPSNAEASRTA